MTRKLEELFNIAASTVTAPVNSVEIIDPDTIDTIDTNVSPGILENSREELKEIELALPSVKGLEASDGEMDDLAKKATDNFDTLMDLGKEVEVKFAAEIFSVASTLLSHAITAKTAKINKKLKLLDLHLRNKGQKPGMPLDPMKTGIGRVLDRNELLEVLNTRNLPENPPK